MKVPLVDADSDYAGCVLTRKSTTGAYLFHGVNLFNAFHGVNLFNARS